MTRIVLLVGSSKFSLQQTWGRSFKNLCVHDISKKSIFRWKSAFFEYKTRTFIISNLGIDSAKTTPPSRCLWREALSATWLFTWNFYLICYTNIIHSFIPICMNETSSTVRLSRPFTTTARGTCEQVWCMFSLYILHLGRIWCTFTHFNSVCV